ncbi:MAG: sigma 54-interacting transcriptional regulator [Deltaproteobacteria bacterium]|jgi:DNA-binding NtrC family response regulator|nr:sigma 54-interacting transcriptional regulator [Deltaproteobacteria bacterium]MBW2532065.1 sigma 54-interacting transcriptional regulator [Deltaproteobacteria bacterium]
MAEVQATTRRPAYRYVTGGTLRYGAARTVPIGAEPITVGRDRSADVCIDDAAVSALHCELRGTAKGVLLRDLDSTNGTLVGQVAVREALLVGRCLIRVGSADLDFTPAEGPEMVDDGEAVDSFGPLLGASPPMRQLYRTLATVASTDLAVLVTGETGSGKELVAKAIHEASPRRDGPFVVVDCGALPTGLAESLLFGHEKGAFTGATERSPGAFLQADGGTLFLDELGELPELAQPKLLRAVAEGSIKRVGGAKYASVDVRIVAATRRDLRRAVNAGRFRDDLFFRIAQVRVELPPLRDRVEDIPQLVAEACLRLDRSDAAPRVSGYIEARFRRHDWPGNVRELMSVASVLAALGDDGMDDVDDMLPVEQERVRSAGSVSAAHFVQAKREFEGAYFRRLLAATGGNISEISRRCGLARHQVRSHLKKLGLMQ